MGLTPTFPAYTGPYKVGTVDVELAVDEFSGSGSGEAPDVGIETIHFRVFYPCQEPSSKPKSVRWLPQPQREFVAAYARFTGFSPFSAGIISYVRTDRRIRAFTNSY